MSGALKPKWWRTLRWRIFGFFLCLFSAGALAIVLEFASLSRSLTASSHQQTHAEVAANIARGLQPLLDRNASFPDLMKVGEGVASTNPNLALYIVGPEGTIKTGLSPHTSVRRSSVPVEPIERLLTQGLETLPILMVDPSHGDLRPFSAARISYQGSPAYLVAILDGSDLVDNASGVAREDRLILTWGFIIAISYATAILISLVASALIARRFEAILHAIRAYRDGTLDTRVPVHGNDELDLLAESINEMATTIESSVHELERRDRLRRELIANVSHDLRSPVSHIRIAAEELSEKEERTRRPPLEIAKALEAGAGELEEMLRELFDLGELEAKERMPKQETFSVEELLDELELRFSGEATAKRISLKTNVAESLPPIQADVVLIRRALGNLIQNALRYTPPEGFITLTGKLRSHSIVIAVSDTGVGIASENLERVFDRSFRGRGDDNSWGSSGLGLAIVKRIVELHGGSIQVESELKKGTTFVMELPLGTSCSDR